MAAAYLEVGDPDFLKDVNSRKEFIMFMRNTDRKEDDDDLAMMNVDQLLSGKKFLQYHSYQLALQNFYNPNTPIQRMLIKWEAGMGKTYGSVGVALEFIPYFKKMETETFQPSVFIIGFSEMTFKNQLLRFPELKFITETELKYVNKLKQLISKGRHSEKTKLKEIMMRVKKRFNNRNNNGFFKFIGYRALVNRLFMIGGRDSDGLTTEEIKTKIKTKEININKSFLETFRSSLVICDEIHNVYNSLDKNNWGFALEYILDNMPSTKAIFMSATPINNKPSEIIDLLNLLIPNQKFARTDFFKENMLLPGALVKIKTLCRGRVSFLRDTNPKLFPSRKIVGESIKGTKYLKFIRCPMSADHYATYTKNYNGALSQDSSYLVDFALPNPKSNLPDELIYKTQVVKRLLSTAPDSWKNKMGIRYDADTEKITGKILQLKTLHRISAKYHRMMTDLIESIKMGNGKVLIYHPIVRMSGVLFIEEVLKANGVIGEHDAVTANTLCAVCGLPNEKHSKKATIGAGETLSPYLDLTTHDSSITSEVDTVKIFSDDNESYSLAKSGGFELDYAKSNDKYYILSKPKHGSHESEDGTTEDKDKKKESSNAKDKKKDNHEFLPARFAIIHANIDKVSVWRSKEKFNSRENSNGSNLMVLIGSKIIKEAHNFYDVRQEWVVGRPNNISTLKQIFGRANRSGSHLNLPIEKRTIEYRLYTTCLPIKYKKGPHTGKYMFSYEEEKYISKIKEYEINQQIEKSIHEVAWDGRINHDIIHFEGEFVDTMKAFDMLDYDTEIGKINAKSLNLSTFRAFHAQKEVDALMRIIKRLFMEISPIYTYDDLWKHAARPPFESPLYHEAISEAHFMIALHKLTYDPEFTEPLITNIYEGRTLADSLLNNTEKFISHNEQTYVILHHKYYMLCPFIDGRPVTDLEIIYRRCSYENPKMINIRSFLEKSKGLFNYAEKTQRFYNKWKNTEIDKLELAVCDFGLDFHKSFAEDCIKYIFSIWTDDVKKHFMHDFYFKMLYYYNLRSLIVWAFTAKDFIAKRYDKYVSPVDMKLLDKTKMFAEFKGQSKSFQKQLTSSNLINLLKSSINTSIINWAPSEAREEYKTNLKKSLELFKGNYKKQTKSKKVPANMLPVGHIVSAIPRFYDPADGWFDSPEYVESKEIYTENNIIVGMDEKSKTGIHIRFKLRPPMKKIKKYVDARKTERGSICSSSKNKKYLRDIAELLGIKQIDKVNVTNLCDDIRRKLIYNELKERLNKTKIKWFYFSYEKQPGM
jgi:hypothetical protein